MPLSNDDILTGLTPAQVAAVTHQQGPLLVLAGPGSGKTRVITHRVAWLIGQGVAPWHILAITFTNKAAQEMRDRLTGMRVPRGSMISTFHALAARLLREFADQAGLSAHFTIYDTADQKAAMRQSLKVLELDSQRYQPAKMLARISNLKNDLITPEQFAQKQQLDFTDTIVARIYHAYQRHLTANGALDFDDLLIQLSYLLRDNETLRQALNERYQYVLVDEYQDTNSCQYQIARGLSLDHSNLFVTGDPDQSIYAWRGADINNILAFEKDYPSAQVVRLEENFRSTPEVLQLSDDLIAHNTQRKVKKLFTSNASGPAPQLTHYDTEHAEAAGMADWIGANKAEGIGYAAMAVFYRVNAMSRVLEQALREHKIPYQIVRGLEFFQRKEIKDLLAYLRFMVNAEDRLSFARIVNTPLRGIGDTTVKRLSDYVDEKQMSIGAVIQNVEVLPTLNAGTQTKVKEFAQLIEQMRALTSRSVAETLRKVYDLSGLEAMLATPANEDQAANVEELINSAIQYDHEAEAPSLADYLQQIALISDADEYDDTSGAVSLMSLHAAKGLEFPAVLIVGLEDGLIPHARSVSSESELEEERRLLFVGITRAAQRLAFTCAGHRTVHGQSLATIRSQFLRELTGLDIRYQEATDASTATDDWEDDVYYDTTDSQVEPNGFAKDQWVRHLKFGVGRVQQFHADGENSKAVIQFRSAGKKTIYLRYAALEPVDFPR